jgi:hypothetical protein
MGGQTGFGILYPNGIEIRENHLKEKIRGKMLKGQNPSIRGMIDYTGSQIILSSLWMTTSILTFLRKINMFRVSTIAPENAFCFKSLSVRGLNFGYHKIEGSRLKPAQGLCP